MTTNEAQKCTAPTNVAPRQNIVTLTVVDVADKLVVSYFG